MKHAWEKKPTNFRCWKCGEESPSRHRKSCPSQVPPFPIYRPALATLAADAAAAAQRIAAVVDPVLCVCCERAAPLVPNVDLDICEACYNAIEAAWFEEMQEYSKWTAEELLG